MENMYSSILEHKPKPESELISELCLRIHKYIENTKEKNVNFLVGF